MSVQQVAGERVFQRAAAGGLVGREEEGMEVGWHL